MKSVAFICKYSWVGISASVLNSAIFWESNGYCVDIYCEKPNLEKFPLPGFADKKINWIISGISGRYFSDDFYFRFKYFKNRRYDWIIGFDHTGIIRALIVSLGTKSKLIYHSLEFYEPEKKSFKRKLVKYIEILSSFKSRFIFTQDQYRIDFLKNDLKQRATKFKIIYNSSYGNTNLESSDYFRDIFNISKQKKIVLCVGSLIKEHYIIDLLNSMDSWDENFVLVLHGWIPDETTRKFVDIKIQDNPDSVFLSEKLFNSENKDIVFQSCDIGFVGFVPINNNLRFAAGSAGKISDFIKSGKPILAFNSPGMKEIIEDNSVGVVFNFPSEIGTALRIITKEYDVLKQNTLTCFRKYDFMKQYEIIFREFIEYKNYCNKFN
ncbi:MAG: glycosyltransferase [Bacteroidia bacterium]|nr:glycosyltransferase [Bacteroidia bacterium]